MQKSINSFFEDLTKHPRWTSFKSEVKKKLNTELAKLKNSISQDTWHSAEKNYSQIIKTLSQAQTQVDLEVQKALKTIKHSAAELEKTIKQYKSLALKQRQKVSKSKSTSIKKATGAKKTRKKITTKAAKASKA